MMKNDRGTYRGLVCLIFSLSSAVLCHTSCSTGKSLPAQISLNPETAENPDDDRGSVSEETAAVQTLSFSAEEQDLTDAGNLAEVRRLWYAGSRDEARHRFNLHPDERDDEWHLWRGKLFIEQWNGSDLGLAGENISALLSDNDDIWAGTWTGGLVRFSYPLGTYTLWDPGLPSLAVRTVNRILNDGKLIRVVRYASIENYDKRSGEWYTETGLPAADRLQDLCVIGNKTYLATLGHGLWEKTDYSWRQVSFPGLFINRLEQGRENELLIATMDRGLYLLDCESGNWTQPPSDILRSSNITSLILSGESVAGGTYGGGGFIWNTVNSDVRIFGKEESGDPWVLSVIEEGERIYFGTFGTGLNIWDIVTGEWDRISLSEGLKSADIACLAKDDSGNIWAGTLGGGIIRITGSIYGD